MRELTLGGRDVIEVLLQDLAGLERQNLPPDDSDLIAGLGISAPSRALAVHDEVAESGYLNFLSFFQTALDDLECGLDYVGRVLF